MTSTIPRRSSRSGPSEVNRQSPRRRSGSRRPASNLEKQLVFAVAVLAGIGASFASSAPTGTKWIDLVFRFSTAAVVTLAASRSRRWTWLFIAGLAAVGAGSGWDLVLAGAAVLVAAAGSLFDRHRITGAITAALAVQALFRLPDMGFLGSSTVFAMIAVLPVLVSGYMQLGRRARRNTKRVALGIAGVWALGSVVFAMSVLFAWNSANQGVREAKEGLAAVGDSRTDLAVDLFAQSEASMRRASSVANAWWTAPSRLVPVVAQQARVLGTVTEGGVELAGSAGSAAREADVQSFRYESGQLDLEALEAAQGPTDDVVARLDAVSEGLRAASSPWLVNPVQDRLDRLAVEVDGALEQARLGQIALRNVPGLLGGDGTRTYMVLFTQPAEARGLGGFVGSWAVLTATDGRLELTRSGRARDINEAPGRDERVLSGPSEYLERYGKFQPARYFQDLTFSPDFASVAQVVAEIYPQAGGEQLDGVIAVDPTGLAALLELTGPIHIPDADVTLDADTAVEFLMVDQYTKFGAGEGDDEDKRADREDFLEQAGRLTFEKLVTGTLPSPRRLGGALGPAVTGRHLMFQSFRGDEQNLFRALGAGGEVEHAAGSDYLAVVTQNKGNNKIDTFMHRSIDYRVTFDPVTGATTGRATVEIRNDAPASGLPESVIGSNDQGLPPGTNSSYLSLYTPLRVTTATVDGEPVKVEFQHEFGYAVFSHFIEIPPGGTTTVVFELEGTLAPGALYDLKVATQPVPNPDTLNLRIEPAAGASVVRAEGLGVVRGGIKAAGSATLETDRRFTVEFVR